jgi:hypothetical protein
MESISNIYISYNCKIMDKIINTTRPVGINWELNIESIIELSEIELQYLISPETKINIIDRIIYEKKESSQSCDEIIENESTCYEFIENNAKFWNLIEKINWFDIDIRYLDKSSITNIFNFDERLYLKYMINTVYIPEMHNNTNSLELFDKNDYNNVISHIIMKGLVFYNHIKRNPSVIVCLIGQYYPVYDWLN